MINYGKIKTSGQGWIVITCTSGSTSSTAWFQRRPMAPKRCPSVDIQLPKPGSEAATTMRTDPLDRFMFVR